MKSAPDAMGTVEAKVLIDQLPGLYFAVLKSTHLEQSSEASVHCTFELPVLGTRTATAPTALQAIRAALLELTDVLTRTPPEQWPQEWRDPALSQPTAPGVTSSEEDDQAERFKSKARQFTIGVTMPQGLKTSLQDIADRHQSSFAEVARRLAAAGFEDFDERSYSEGSKDLLSLLSSEVRRWQPAETEQVMVRIEPRLAARLRSAAKEYRRSASEFGAMCLAHGYVLQAQFAEIEQKVSAYRGPAIRRLAANVGLGSYATPLLSGVLAGSVRAPKKLLGRLSDVIGAPAQTLASYFSDSFASRHVPAFKAEAGKPQVSTSATAWEDAVKSLKLPADQTKELLRLDE